MDTKHLQHMPDEEQKRYLYVTIDRATLWAYLGGRPSQSVKQTKAYMKCMEEKITFTI